MISTVHKVAYDVGVALAAFLVAVAFVLAVRGAAISDANLVNDIGRILAGALGVFGLCVALRLRTPA